jgi:hypothetical protein
MGNSENHNYAASVLLSEVEGSLEIRLVRPRDLIRSLPVGSAFGLPVHVAASPATPFSTALGMTNV